MRKILPISLKLNFTPNTLGCYGLKERRSCWTAIKSFVRVLIGSEDLIKSTRESTMFEEVC